VIFLVAFLNSPCYETPKNVIKKSSKTTEDEKKKPFFVMSPDGFFFFLKNGAAAIVRHFRRGVFFTAPFALAKQVQLSRFR
jgi:hypothetical protein